MDEIVYSITKECITDAIIYYIERNFNRKLKPDDIPHTIINEVINNLDFDYQESVNISLYDIEDLEEQINSIKK